MRLRGNELFSMGPEQRDPPSLGEGSDHRDVPGTLAAGGRREQPRGRRRWRDMKRESGAVPGQAPALLILQARRDEQIVTSGKERAVRRERDRSAIGWDCRPRWNDQRSLGRGEGRGV